MQSPFPLWLNTLISTVIDGLAYDYVKWAVGAAFMTLVGILLAKYKNALSSGREIFYVSVGSFLILYIFLAFVAPRTQSPQLNGTIESVMFGSSDQQVDSIAVFTLGVYNTGTMQSTLKNWSVTATINGRIYQGAFLVPAPANFEFKMPNATPSEPPGVMFHGVDNIIEKTIAPIAPGSVTKGVLFVVFKGIDSSLFKAGADYTISFEDIYSKRYIMTIASSAHMDPIRMSSGVRTDLMCPAVGPPTTPMSTAPARPN